MTNRLTAGLRSSRGADRLFLVGYLPAGYPSREGFVDGVRAAFGAGADAMEIALTNPPLPLDGELIQKAVAIGGANITGPLDTLQLAASGRTDDDQSLIALAYQHAFDSLGGDELIEICVRTGVDAILLPQHTLADQIAFAHRVRAAGLEQVLFLYLESDLKVLAGSGLRHPVIYLQSADLQTGGEFDSDKAHERLGELRAALGDMDAYILVGFGIRGPVEVAAIASSTADGAIVGTVMVAAAADGPGAIAQLVSSIRPALVDTAIEAHHE